METTPAFKQDTPTLPPKEKPTRRVRHYLDMFGTSFVKTFGVGLGVAVLLFAFGAATSVSQKSQCNVSVRTLYGELNTYPLGQWDETDSGTLVRSLERDEQDDGIIAVVLDVDSPGGYPVAGEEVSSALLRLTKPNVAVIRSTGASAAYWAAMGADYVFASRSSDVGSIGVIVSFPDESEKNKTEGVAYNEFTSGTFKNLGTPTRPVTKDEKALIERDIKEVHENFVSAVSAQRNLSIEKVRALADGSSMTGSRAKEEGLIDAIGGFEEAKVYLAEKLGVPVVFCEPNAEPLF